MRERLTDYNLLSDGGRTLTLVGAPGPISHQLEFHNGGEQRAILRQATLVSPQLETATGQRPGVVMPSVVLHPGQARRFPSESRSRSTRRRDATRASCWWRARRSRW